MSQRLFHGTTEESLKEKFRPIWDLPANWTSCPLDALSHSYSAALRERPAKLAVITISDYSKGHFLDAETLHRDCGEIKWKSLDRPFVHGEVERKVQIYCLTTQEIKGKTVKDLAAFVKEHFDEKHNHLDSLKAMKYWDLIFPDSLVQELGFYQLQRKPKRA